MADENTTENTAEASATVTPAAPTVKKTRAKRRQKAVAEAVPTSPSTTVKSPRAYRKKSLTAASEAKPLAVATSAAGKGIKTAGIKAIAGNKSGTKASKATTAAGDEMFDLVQLEEENKTLRKALADKLRAENADLRKRLG